MQICTFDVNEQSRKLNVLNVLWVLGTYQKLPNHSVWLDSKLSCNFQQLSFAASVLSGPATTAEEADSEMHHHEFLPFHVFIFRCWKGRAQLLKTDKVCRISLDILIYLSVTTSTDERTFPFLINLTDTDPVTGVTSAGLCFSSL